MRLQILGTGCPKCKTLADHAAQAVRELGIEATVEKVTNLDDILAFGVLMTPALAIDGAVKSAGKVLSVEQIKRLLS